MRSSARAIAAIVLSLLVVQAKAAARQNFSESMRAAALEFGQAQRYLHEDLPALTKAMETMAGTAKPETLSRCTAPMRLFAGKRAAAAALLVNPVCGECDRVVELMKKLNEQAPQDSPTLYLGEVPSSEEASIEAVVLLKHLAGDPDARLALLQELLSRQPPSVEVVREIARAYAPAVVAQRERHELSDEAPCDKEVVTPVIIYRDRVLQKTRVGRIAFDPLRNIESLRIAFAAVDDLQAPAVESAAAGERDERAICRNATVLRAFRIMTSACGPDVCDFSRLKELEQLDRAELLHGLRDPHLMPVHLFFRRGRSRLTEALDWQTIKRDQLRTIAHLNNPANSTVFIVGYSSGEPGEPGNPAVSRMLVVHHYLKDELRVRCKGFLGVFLRGNILPLHSEDARQLGVVSKDYRGSEKILNQGVHVYVYPCADQL